MIKKRKVSFYKLTQEKHTYIKERNTTEIRNLDNITIENNFKYIYDNKTNSLSNGNRAITVRHSSNDYVLEIIEFKDHEAFIKIGQQNSVNTVALRDVDTLETERVPMSDTQQLELFTYFLIDFTTGIVSYIGVNGAPKISVIRTLFDEEFVATQSTYTKIASILTTDILNTLIKKKTISKLTVTYSVPEDNILSNSLGVDKNTFDCLRNVKTRTASLKLVATRNKNILDSSGSLVDLITSIKEKFGSNLLGLTANAKDDNEESQPYNLLQYCFTKTVTIGDESSIITESDFKSALKNTYNNNKDELLRYAKV